MDPRQLREAYGRATGRAADSATVTRLPGGAGNRTYWRVAENGRSAVVMELPLEPGKSEEASKDFAPPELPFLNVHRYLEKLGVRVPRVLLDQHRQGCLVIEDLGDVTLEVALGSARGEAYVGIYETAIDQLARLRARAEKAVDPSCLAYGRAFDFDLYQWEFEHFIEYGLLGRGAQPSASELSTLRTAFEAVSQQLAAAPRGFTHRDYQSRNIMVLAPKGSGGPPVGEQVVIDFQDALQGPRQYDLVALLRDSYVELQRPLVERLLRRYLARVGDEGGPRLPEAEFIGFFDLLTVQRKLKDAGRFVFIDQVKKNPSFLPHIPASLRYVKDALARRPELGEVAAILARHVPELR
jgi:aminoglycoside/choline kinase family phosphotransferase